MKKIVALAASYSSVNNQVINSGIIINNVSPEDNNSVITVNGYGVAGFPLTLFMSDPLDSGYASSQIQFRLMGSGTLYYELQMTSYDPVDPLTPYSNSSYSELYDSICPSSCDESFHVYSSGSLITGSTPTSGDSSNHYLDVVLLNIGYSPNRINTVNASFYIS